MVLPPARRYSAPGGDVDRGSPIMLLITGGSSTRIVSRVGQMLLAGSRAPARRCL